MACNAASCIEDEAERIDAFDALAPISLTNHRRKRALWETASASEEDKIVRINALGNLASQLSAPMQQEVMWEALHMALSIKEDFVACRALMILIPYTTGTVREALLEEAVTIALATKDSIARYRILKAIAPYQANFIRQRLLKEALPIIRGLTDKSVRIAALRALDTYLPDSLLQEALSADQDGKQTTQEEKQTAQVKALVVLVPHLSPPIRERLAWKAFETARTLRDKGTRLKSLSTLACHLSWTLRSKVLDEVMDSMLATVSEKQQATELLIALAPYCRLWKRGYRKGFKALRMLIWGSIQTWMLSQLLSPLKDSWSWKGLQKGLRLLQPTERKLLLAKISIWSLSKLSLITSKAQHLTRIDVLVDLWVKGLTAVVPHMRGALKKRVLREALASLQTIKYSHTRSEMLVLLSQYLPESSQQEVLKVALKTMIKDGVVSLEALTALVPHLPQPLQQELVEAVQGIQDRSICSEVLVTLTPYLPEPLKKKALQGGLVILQTMADQKQLAETLNRILPRLTTPLTEQLLQDALTTLRTMKDKQIRSEVLQILLPHFSRLHLEEVLAIVQSIGDEDIQTEALAKQAEVMAKHGSALLHDQKEQLSFYALTAAKKVKNRLIQTKTLLAISAYLPESLQRQIPQELLRLIQETEDDSEQVKILQLIAPHLSESLLMELLADTELIKDRDHRIRKISILTPHIKSKQVKLKVLRDLLRDTPKIENESNLSEALCALAPNLPELVLQEALALVVQRIDIDKPLKEALDQIWPKLPAQIQREVRIAIQTAEGSNERLDALTRLSQHLSDLYLGETDKSVHKIEVSSGQTILLAIIKHRLENILWNSKILPLPVYLLARILSLNSRKITAKQIQESFEILYEAKGEIKRIVEFISSIKNEVEKLNSDVLKIIEKIESNENRAKILTALLPHLLTFEEDDLFQDVRWEAQWAAKHIENPFERVKAMVALLPYSDKVALMFPIDIGCTTKQDMGNRLGSIKIMTFLVPELMESLNLPADPDNDDFLEGALIAFRNIKNLTDRAKAHTILLPYLSAEVKSKVFGLKEPVPTSVSVLSELLEDLLPYILERVTSGALKIMQLSKNKNQRSAVLTLSWESLKENLKDRMPFEPVAIDRAVNIALQEFLKNMQVAENKTVESLMLILLAKQLPEPIKGIMLHHAQVTAQYIEDKSVQAETLSRLAPQLVEPLLKDVFLNIVQTVEYGRIQAFENLVPFLLRISKYDLYLLWTTALHTLSLRGRADILKDICILTPIIFELGGIESVAETDLAIQDTGRWWV